ncbi:hypothetical protein SAMN04489727_6388 [Amycolatopsis tolypomycina]|uniref:Uncharacterized protein n=1 Tax=Amycolatopsis tolypomycina TaxID=208445 RepID=A0A1H4XV03_9PSEU|nr:hypothetical protein SAMN04489727_6388 [Amycolatopsis tolypomycina]
MPGLAVEGDREAVQEAHWYIVWLPGSMSCLDQAYASGQPVVPHDAGPGGGGGGGGGGQGSGKVDR